MNYPSFIMGQVLIHCYYPFLSILPLHKESTNKNLVKDNISECGKYQQEDIECSLGCS